MSEKFITENIWIEITASAKRTNTKSYAAVAYFGRGASSMLPLKKGSMLVVDASENVVMSGQTCPAELLKLCEKGVLIYSYPNLHAKVFVLGKRLYVGSTNVSYNSANWYSEAVLMTTDRKLMNAGKSFVKGKCLISLGPKRLRQLKKIYRPPQFPRGRRTKGKKESGEEGFPPLYVFHLESTRYSEEEERKRKVGIKRAEKRREFETAHKIDEFAWDNTSSLRNGRLALMISDENKTEWISPPGTIIHVERSSKRSRGIVFVEIPIMKTQRMTVLNELLSNKEKRMMKRDGRKSQLLTKKILSLWK